MRRAAVAIAATIAGVFGVAPSGDRPRLPNASAGTPDGASATALQETGALALASGRYDLAVSVYVRIVRQNPRDRAAQGILGCALMKLGRDTLGYRFLSRAGQGPWSACTPVVTATPPSRREVETHALLALALLMRGRNDEALAESRSALLVDPGRDDAHDVAGEVHLRLGRFEAAEREFRSAIRLRPNDAEYYFDLARALAAEQRVPEAIRAAHTATRLDPSEATYLELRVRLEQELVVRRT